MPTEGFLYFPAISAFSFSALHGELPISSPHQSAMLLLACEDADVIVGMRRYTVAKGDVLLLPPFTLFLSAKKNGSILGYQLNLPYEALSVFAPKALSASANMGCVFSVSKKIRADLTERFQVLLEKRDPAHLALPSLFSLLEKDGSITERSPVVLPLLLRRALKYINEHVNENISAAVLAERYGVSESTVLRAFRDHFSITPLAYEKHLRALLAQEPK